MKVLVTGHRGYIGVEMVPELIAAGHEVVGLDTGLYDACDFVVPPDEVPALDVDLRDVTQAQLAGIDAVVHLGALSNDPLGDLNAQLTYDINLEASVRLATARGAGVARFLFVVVQPLRSGRQRPAGRAVTVLSGHPVRRLQGACRASTARACQRQLLTGVLAQRHRVWRLPPPSGRHRREQPCRARRDDRQVLLQSDGSPWRPLVHLRDIIAAFIACLHAPREAIHDEAFNVGMIDENYPDPRSRRDRAGRRAELRDRLRPWGLPGYPQLSGRLPQDRGGASVVQAVVDGALRRRGAVQGVHLSGADLG